MPLVSGLVLFLNYLNGNLTLHGVFALPEFLAFVVQNMDSVIGCQSPELTLRLRGFGAAIETHALYFLKWEVFILGFLSYMLDFRV